MFNSIWQLPSVAFNWNQLELDLEFRPGQSVLDWTSLLGKLSSNIPIYYWRSRSSPVLHLETAATLLQIRGGEEVGPGVILSQQPELTRLLLLTRALLPLVVIQRVVVSWNIIINSSQFYICNIKKIFTTLQHFAKQKYWAILVHFWFVVYCVLIMQHWGPIWMMNTPTRCHQVQQSCRTALVSGWYFSRVKWLQTQLIINTFLSRQRYQLSSHSDIRDNLLTFTVIVGSALCELHLPSSSSSSSFSCRLSARLPAEAHSAVSTVRVLAPAGPAELLPLHLHHPRLVADHQAGFQSLAGRLRKLEM